MHQKKTLKSSSQLSFLTVTLCGSDMSDVGDVVVGTAEEEEEEEAAEEAAGRGGGSGVGTAGLCGLRMGTILRKFPLGLRANGLMGTRRRVAVTGKRGASPASSQDMSPLWYIDVTLGRMRVIIGCSFFLLLF